MTPITLEAMAEAVPDGALLALPPDYSLPAVALARALVRRGARGLRLLGVPILGFSADLLIGAGCVAEVETSAVTLGEAGFAPRFTAAVRAGTLRLRDATCPAIHAMLQAAEKGVPFLPLRGLIGSDILAHRPDWTVVANPFAPPGPTAERQGMIAERQDIIAERQGTIAAPSHAIADPIVLLPALRPDIAIFHAAIADAEGNVWIGRRREIATAAHAARRSLVTVERVVEGNLLEDERLAPGVVGGLYVEAVAVAERGAWPSGLLDEYGPDPAHVADYARLARTEQGFAEYCARHVLAGPHAAAAE